MSVRKKRWLIAIVAAFTIVLAAAYVGARILMRRLEPMVHEETVRYLRERFHSEVELAALHIHLPHLSAIGLILRRERGARVAVDGDNLVVKRHAGGDPLLAIHKLSFDVDIASIIGKKKVVDYVLLEGVQITVPPKGGEPSKVREPPSSKPDKPLDVQIQQVDIQKATLLILPTDQKRKPFRYQIDRLHLTSVGRELPMNYDAILSIPTPPGQVRSNGRFGPWNVDEPGDTALAGNYKYENADLGVFKGIAGILNSTGEFQGTLDAITAKGQAVVRDFRLKMTGQPVPLRTQFEVLVDGTNGNTVLQPVHATLGHTNFTTTGTVIKHEDEVKRTISLAVRMPDGNLADLLRLSVKDPPFMEGRIALNTRIDIPPLSARVKQKLVLDGTFNVRDAKFLRSTIQSQIDNFSRRGQGQPKNEEIDSVASDMKGSFHLENQVMTFRSLFFAVPGAAVELAGNYNLKEDTLDFRGTLALMARVSNTVTGWKHWALKPIDPLFAKNGAGTFLHIQVEGDAHKPKFGVELRPHKDKRVPAQAREKVPKA